MCFTENRPLIKHKQSEWVSDTQISNLLLTLTASNIPHQTCLQVIWFLNWYISFSTDMFHSPIPSAIWCLYIDWKLVSNANIFIVLFQPVSFFLSVWTYPMLSTCNSSPLSFYLSASELLCVFVFFCFLTLHPLSSSTLWRLSFSQDFLASPFQTMEPGQQKNKLL